MNANSNEGSMDRRSFMKTSAAAVAGSAAISAGTGKALAAIELDHRNERPDKMQYRKLGRSNFMCSRLAFGCGAALAGGKAVHLLEHAFEAGINFYDSSSNRAYKGTEAALAPFLNRHRDEMWISSKSIVRVEPGKALTVQMAKDASDFWLATLDQSLANFKVERLDSYYLLGMSDPAVIKSEEIYNGFLKAKEAGKVRHLGFSTHQNAQECLEAAIEAGWYSIAMVAITPAGWFDLRSGKTLNDRGSLKDLRPVLDRAREAGIGLIGMKSARFLAQKDNEHAFDGLYDASYMAAKLSPFQRSYAYILENGLDVVNADMQNIKHFEENLHAARTSSEHFA